jgi:hypothetical protein
MNIEKPRSFCGCLSPRNHHCCYLGTLIGFELGSSSANLAFGASGGQPRAGSFANH